MRVRDYAFGTGVSVCTASAKDVLCEVQKMP
jgi:hypothetical protein